MQKSVKGLRLTKEAALAIAGKVVSFFHEFHALYVIKKWHCIAIIFFSCFYLELLGLYIAFGMINFSFYFCRYAQCS